MKRIFSFLLTIGLVFSFAGDAFGQDVILKSGAKVRYAIEKKVVTQAEASTLAAQGYVDLWAYALFNKGYWEKAATGETLISFSGSTIDEWNIAFTPPTHSFLICEKDGNYKPSGTVMFSKPSTLSTCSSDRVPSQRGSTNGLCAIQFIRNVCPTYTYASSPLSGSSTVGAPNFIENYTDENGVEWYRMKLYTIRYDYNSVQTFCTRFWSSYETGVSLPANNLAESPGSSTFTVAFEGLPIKGSDNWTWADQDWQAHLRYDRNTDKYGFIQGGVEVISDPEMLLTAEATCGGTDATGKLTVNDWAEKTWADYSGVKFYVNKTGGTVSGRKQVSAGDLTATIPTTGTAAEIAYTLTPSGYTMPDGSYADSLIWVIEDTFLA